MLENVGFKKGTRDVNYNDTNITENTRAAYPLSHIANAQIPAICSHPNNIIFLTNDAFSVLPPVSKLTPEQAIYHFYSGYSAKITETEQGIKEPTAHFSACYGEAFLPLKSSVYANLLYEKIQKQNVNVWLVNTGWTGGRYGVGKRITISNTRTIIDSIHNGSLNHAEYDTLPIFNLRYPTSVSGIDSRILNPKDSWRNKEEYNMYARKVAEKFTQNFERFADDASEEIKKGAPCLD